MQNDKKNDALHILQAKGKLCDSDIENSDMISSVSFNHTGSLIAVGDRGGRVVILSKNNNKNKHSTDEYNVYSTFQSHEPDFDYLKSVEIEEKINKISWLIECQYSNFIVTTNDKTIKLFRISDNVFVKDGGNKNNIPFCKNIDTHKQSTDEVQPNGIRVKREPSFCSLPLHEAKCRRVFSNAHHYNIHSIGACSNQEYFISADDLRINLWSLQRNDICFTIVDIKPENMESLSEVITCANYHPIEPDIFLYTTSKGTIKLCDTRVKAICDTPTLGTSLFSILKVFLDNNESLNSSRFSEAIFTISSLDISSTSKYFLTRNYLEVKVWDMCMNRNPIETHRVQQYLNNDIKLAEMYEQDCIFDKFEACFSKNDKCIVTGTYDDIFSITKRDSIDITSQSSFYLADYENLKHRGGSHDLEPKIISDSQDKKYKKNCINPNHIKFSRKITSLDCHPNENIIAVA
ncbi:hypothetical protein HZS_7677, partial [Henneguya salminicola]